MSLNFYHKTIFHKNMISYHPCFISTKLLFHKKVWKNKFQLNCVITLSIKLQKKKITCFFPFLHKYAECNLIYYKYLDNYSVSCKTNIKQALTHVNVNCKPKQKKTTSKEIRMVTFATWYRSIFVSVRNISNELMCDT